MRNPSPMIASCFFCHHRLESVLFRLLFGLGLALTFVLGLSGCATTGGSSGSASEQWHTPSDDTDERRRARTRLALAMGYYENGQFAVALDEQKKAVQVDPSFADSHNLGGMIYLALGDPALAESNFQRALALNPRDASVMHNIGWLKCEAAQFEVANGWFERALAVPNYLDRPRTLMTQGVCQIRAGQLAEAEATLMRAYELDAGNPVTGYNLAKLLYDRGDLARARFYIRRLNNSELANAQSLWLGMRIEHRLGDRRAREDLSDQLRRRFPDSAEQRASERGQFDE